MFRFEEVERQLTAGRVFPVYLICGAEDYIVRLIADKIRCVFSAETGGAEVERESAPGLDAVALTDSLKTLPMWSKGKMVIISNASSLSQKAKDHLADYAGRPAPHTVLVLTAEKFDGRSKLAKSFAEYGALIEIPAVYEKHMPSWINSECRSRGLGISQEAAGFMAELTGTNLSAMADAIEKTALFIGGKRKTIELKDVETVLSDTSQRSVFDLTNSAACKDLARAESRLKNLLRNNENPVAIVAMLARHWRLLIKAKELLKKTAGAEKNIASALGVYPLFAKDYIAQSKRFKMKELSEGLGKIWSADVAVKSSRLPKEEILHRLIIELAG